MSRYNFHTELCFSFDINQTQYNPFDDKFYEDPIYDAIQFLKQKLEEGGVSLDCDDARLRVRSVKILWDQQHDDDVPDQEGVKL